MKECCLNKECLQLLFRDQDAQHFLHDLPLSNSQLYTPNVSVNINASDYSRDVITNFLSTWPVARTLYHYFFS